MPRPGIPHLNLARREVLLPPSRHGRSGFFVREKLFGVRGLHAGIDQDGAFIGKMMADHFGAGGVEVGGGLETGEGGPEEVDGAGGGSAGLVGEDHQGPAGGGGGGGEGGGGARVLLLP